jgi:hypothetical protein
MLRVARQCGLLDAIDRQLHLLKIHALFDDNYSSP